MWRVFYAENLPYAKHSRCVLAPTVSGGFAHVMFALAAVSPGDFEELVAIRLATLSDTPERARERLGSSFHPEHSRFIVIDGHRAGFYTLRPADNGFHLEHFYILPPFQSRGVGGAVMRLLLEEAAGRPVFVGVLKGSPAIRFYQRHGFVAAGESERALYYVNTRNALSVGR